MAKLEKTKCETCGGQLDSERGDIEGRECHRCRSADGLMAGLCLGMEANGVDPDHIEGWPAIRLELRKQLGHDLTDLEYLAHLKDLLLAKHVESGESMLRMKLDDVARIIGNRIPPRTRLTETDKVILEVIKNRGHVQSQRDLLDELAKDGVIMDQGTAKPRLAELKANGTLVAWNGTRGYKLSE